MFAVNIAPMETVHVLKYLIKNYKPGNAFEYLKEASLVVWSVSLPVDDKLRNDLRGLNLNPKQSLFSCR